MTECPPLSRLPADLLEEDGLTLRALRADDGPALMTAVLESLEELRPWLPWAHRAYGPEDTAAFLDQMTCARERGTDFAYAIVEGKDLAGVIGLHLRDDPRRLEIGYWVHTAHAGRGLATRSVRLLGAEAVHLGEVDCLEIRHDRANERSGRIPERLGFTYAGQRRKTPQAPGETSIELLWRLWCTPDARRMLTSDP
jgi:ribosomal-protein-serine acetyltransferase